MIGTGEAFEAAYRASVADDVDGAPDHEIADPRGASAGERMTVRVVRAGGAWTASFRRPRDVSRSLSGAYPTPHPEVLCVVAGGDAYLVDVDDPAAAAPIRTGGPVVAVDPLPERGLLLLSSPWHVTAVGDAGVAWQTDRLAIERFRLDEADGTTLAGVADPDDDEPREFAIELATGRHEGGVPFA